MMIVVSDVMMIVMSDVMMIVVMSDDDSGE